MKMKKRVKPQLQKKKEAPISIDDVEAEWAPRKGSNQSFTIKESLPIKRLDGKVVSVKRVEYDRNDEEEEENLSDIEETIPIDDDDDDDEDDDRYKKSSGSNAPEISTGTVQQSKATSVVVSSKLMTDVQRMKSMATIASICKQITADPETSLKKQKARPDKADGTTQHGMNDLFVHLESSDFLVAEAAMLSALLVFKDIAPGYRIRQKDETASGGAGADKGPNNDEKLKKETQRIRDFELSLLVAYQRYLRHLETKIKNGLGNPKRDIEEWTPSARLGLSALRCQCELLRWLPHFNFRAILLNSVVIRAAQCNEDVSSISTKALSHIFQNDKDFELSYEATRIIAKVLAAFKYECPEGLVACLRGLKLTVHADEAKGIRMKSKKERRKRKRSQDEVDVELMEAQAVTDKTIRQRFQVDTLQEVAMIYFRIVKLKIGFTLLPAALEGLGSITHLINFDMVEDLIPVIKHILLKQPPVPVDVKALCVHCVLRTLLGPGEELQVDNEVFALALKDLLNEIPFSGFDKWDKVLESIEMLLLKRRETRNNLILSIVNRMLAWSCHMQYTIASSTLTLAHAILLRYPKIRADSKIFRVPGIGGPDEEDEHEVQDLAMKSLREAGEIKANDIVDGDGDASRVLTLLRHHIDPRCRRIVSTMLGKDAVPLPYRLIEARAIDDATIVNLAIESMALLPPKHPSLLKKISFSAQKTNTKPSMNKQAPVKKGAPFGRGSGKGKGPARKDK